MSPLLRLLATMTLPGCPALALFMASTMRGLGCSGAALLIVLTVTSLRSLLGKLLCGDMGSIGRGCDSICIRNRGLGSVLGNSHTYVNQQKPLMDQVQSRSYGGLFAALAEEGLGVRR